MTRERRSASLDVPDYALFFAATHWFNHRSVYLYIDIYGFNPQWDRRRSWPGWFVAYRDGLTVAHPSAHQAQCRVTCEPLDHAASRFQPSVKSFKTYDFCWITDKSLIVKHNALSQMTFYFKKYILRFSCWCLSTDFLLNLELRCPAKFARLFL